MEPGVSCNFVACDVDRIHNMVLFFPQLRVGRKDGPEGRSQEAVPALPVHHPRQAHIQRTAAAETHETRECKKDVLAALSSTFRYSMSPLLI